MSILEAVVEVAQLLTNGQICSLEGLILQVVIPSMVARASTPQSKAETSQLFITITGWVCIKGCQWVAWHKHHCASATGGGGGKMGWRIHHCVTGDRATI